MQELASRLLNDLFNARILFLLFLNDFEYLCWWVKTSSFFSILLIKESCVRGAK